jgi:ribonuclease P protein component
MPTTEAPQGRISVIVPKKVSARAVTRNSLRRRVYSLIRAEVDIPQDVAILVFVKKDFARPDRPNIQAELQTLFKNF